MIRKILKVLNKKYPGRGACEQEDPFKTLISTILSQRTKEEQTELTSKRLFARFSTPKALASGPVSEIEELIKGSGYFRQKAKRIRKVARIIVEEYEGRVPEDEGELLKLPGVGPKTAGCVLLYGFGKMALPVDTHVHRISNRLGWVKTGVPEETEEALKRLIPKSEWGRINPTFVLFGRDICKPVGPKCSFCPVEKYCQKVV